MKIDNGVLRVVNGSLIVLKENRVNGLYFLERTTLSSNSATNMTQSLDYTMSYHIRLGNVSENELSVLVK